MLLKILVVGALAIGLMAAIRNGSVLRDAGLLSTCKATTVDGRLDSQLLTCTKGRLDGFPDLTAKSCHLASVQGDTQLWRCDAPVVSSQSPSG
jgi:hypothetical protein